MFAVIHLADFSLQAVLRHNLDLRFRPAALVDLDLPKPLVIQCTSSARASGVTPGLTPSQALARCPDLEIKGRSPAQEQSATEILLQTAYAFSPNVEATRPGLCTLELKGLGLENPEARRQWSEKIIQALGGFFLEAKIGIAVTPDLAWLATQGEKNIAIIEDAAGFVRRLPVAALAPPPDLAEILPRWGIGTVGEFLELGRGEVCERLGAGALELFDRVSPEAARPLKLMAPPERFSEQIEFETEIETAGPLLLWVRRFSEQLCRRLETIYRVVAQLQLRLGLASGAAYTHDFQIPSPTGDVETLFGMLRTHLETVRTDSPIVSLQLTAIPARPETHQFGLFQNTLRNPNQFAETTVRLAALAGADNVGAPVVAGTHRPDSFRLQPPNFEFIPARDFKPVAKSEGMPFRRFRPPLPAHVEFQEDQPAQVRSRLFTGRVAGARGPYLSSGNWWDESRWAREEWDVEITGGALLRLFRSGAGCFVEGIYD